MNIKKYLLGRADSITAWVGFLGFVLEIVLHLGNVSTIMLILFLLLIVLPEANFRDLFKSWSKNIKDRA